MDNSQNNKSNTPTHYAKARRGHGKNAEFERIGAGWHNPEKETVYVKLNGTQIVEDGFYLFPASSPDEADSQ